MSTVLSKYACCIAVTAFVLSSVLHPIPAEAGRQATEDRLMTREEAEELYDELSDEHGWSRDDMGKALEITRRVKDLFDIYAELFNKDIPPRAIARSFEVCEGYADVIEDYWEMINRNHFEPSEVDTVFSQLPGEIMRHYYFHYRTGGELGKRREAKRETGELPPVGQPGNRFSKDEVLEIFRRTQSDMAVIEPYFEYRMEGVRPPDAWEKVQEQAKERIAEEEERTEREEKETEEERKRRKKEAEEGRKRADELLGKTQDDDDDDDEEDEQERQRGYSLDDLLGNNNDEPDDEIVDDEDDGEETDEQDDKEEQNDQQSQDQEKNNDESDEQPDNS